MNPRCKHLSLLVILFLGCTVARADWPAITPEEKSMTGVPQQPNAPAVVLYREDTTDDTKNFHTVYVRLKILTEAGRKYADVEIPVGRYPFTISQFSGRTVHPDGSIVPLEEQPLDKIVLHDHGVRARVKAFTLPAIQVGSILDYRYSLHFPEGSRNAPEWVVQSELFQEKIVLKFIPTKYMPKLDSLRAPPPGGANDFEIVGNTMGGEPAAEYSWVPYLPAGRAPQEHVTQQALYKWVDLEMSDIPPSIQEPNMPPDSAMQWRVAFFYRNTTRSEDFWKRTGRSWNKAVENFLDRKKGISDSVSQLVGANDPAEMKIQKIYAAVSQLENEDFAASSKPAPVPAARAGAEDVLQKHSGTHDELNRLFVAMVRAAGIPATIMWVPDRGRTTFDPNFMSTDQLDGEIAVVQVGGQDVYLDPGTRFCPYRVLNWHYAGVRGLRQSGSGETTLAETPAPVYTQAVIQRVARLQLSEKGTMEGTLAVGFSGQDAMVLRQQAIGASAEDRRKLLESEVESWLPSGTQVSLTNSPEWEKTEGMLVGKFKVAGPLASKSETGWSVPVNVFQVNTKPRFSSLQRTSPVYFDYASREFDEVHISWPPSVGVESLPVGEQAKTGYAIYTSAHKREGANGIVSTREMAINGVLFTPEEYKELQDFYNKVAAADSQPATLKGAQQAQNN